MGTTTNRQDQANISVSFGGRDCPFKFKMRDGGKITSEGSKTNPAGMEPKVAHGGIQDQEDLNLEGEMKPSRDNAFLQSLKPLVGKVRVAVAEHLLDGDGQVLETINRWTGVLSELDTGKYDASSAEPRMIALTVEVDGVPG